MFEEKQFVAVQRSFRRKLSVIVQKCSGNHGLKFFLQCSLCSPDIRYERLHKKLWRCKIETDEQFKIEDHSVRRT